MAALEASIATLLTRLEQVTNRLESVEKQLASGGSVAPAAGGSAPAAASAPAGSGGEDSPFVQEYDDLVRAQLKDFVEHSKALAPEVGEQAGIFIKSVEHLRWFLTVVAQTKEPTPETVAALVKEIGQYGQNASSLRDANRKSKFWENISAISEGAIGALLWPVASPKPGPYVNEYKGQSEFWSNKILVANKGKDDPAAKAQLAWVAGLNGFLKELIPYIKKFHTTKPAWNANGGDAASFVGKAGSAAAPAAAKKAGGPPPPPAGGPPPPPPASAAPEPKKGDTGALFAALNAGNVTAGLKKVTADMQTHKNPNLRAGGTVPAKDEEKKERAGTEKASNKAPAVSKPAEFFLDGNKWKIAYQKGNKEIVIPEDKIETKHTVYIFQCDNSTIQIKGKVNTIIVDSCKKCAVVFTDAIASVEVVNVNGLEIQCSGRVPSWAIDKSSTVSVYITNPVGLDTEFITSKSDATNILVPGKKEGDDLLEFPVPEQYKTTIKTLADNGKAIETTTVEHKG